MRAYRRGACAAEMLQSLALVLLVLAGLPASKCSQQVG